MRLPRVLEPLRHRDFRLLLTGQTVSRFGNFIYFVALPFQILMLGGSPVQLGLSAAISTGTMVTFLLLGGAIVDRLPRRRIILASDFASGCVVAAISVLGLTGGLRIEHLYVASAFYGMAAAFFQPAMTAIIPELVPAQVLQSGNAINGLSDQSARVAGPVVGGLIVAVAGPPVAFAIDAASFFVSFIALWLARPPLREHGPAVPLLQQVRAGIAFTFSLPWLWITIAIFAFVNLGIAGPTIVALPLLVRDVLHADARVYGAIGTAVGAGQICGTVLSGQFPVRKTGLVMYVWAILAGVAVAAYGLVASLPDIFFFAFAQGLSFVGFGILWDTLLQRHVPREMLGRVSSVDGFGSILLLPIGPLIFAAVVERVGPEGAFVIGGGLSAALCLAALAVHSIRDLE